MSSVIQSTLSFRVAPHFLVAQLAFDRWQHSGQTHGHDLADWLITEIAVNDMVSKLPEDQWKLLKDRKDLFSPEQLALLNGAP